MPLDLAPILVETTMLLFLIVSIHLSAINNVSLSLLFELARDDFNDTFKKVEYFTSYVQHDISPLLLLHVASLRDKTP